MTGIEKKAYTVAEFCDAYGMKRSTAYSEIKTGKLKICKVGRRTLISREDAEKWLKRL